MDTFDKWLTIDELAGYIKMSRTKLYGMTQRGEIPASKIGNQWRFDREEIDLMDRIQQLYQAGMGKFLGEDITYINQNDVNNALRFIKQNPDATQRAVWNLFIQQKFFTNNDFSFIDVHNERLFYQNADVLLRILQMWQDIRLTNPLWKSNCYFSPRSRPLKSESPMPRQSSTPSPPEKRR